tara:strand:+ start:921 stop:1292 length:372 start_codon:yes stop_codon:yes gene_type:complete
MSISGIGPRLPMALDADGGYALLKTLKQTAAQNLKMIVLTDPGERMMDPTFGVGVRRLLFENDTSANVSVIEARIKSQVNKFLPWIKISNIKIDNSEHLFSVIISYYIPALGASQQILSIPVN